MTRLASFSSLLAMVAAVAWLPACGGGQRWGSRPDAPAAAGQNGQDAGHEAGDDAGHEAGVDTTTNAADAPSGIDAADAGDAADAPSERDATVSDRPSVEVTPPDAAPAHLSRWPTMGGGPLRSGFNAVETGRPPLTRAWASLVTPSPTTFWQAVSDGRRVYLASYNSTNYRQPLNLTAHAPTDGHVVWKYVAEPGDEQSTGYGHPTVDGDHLYVGTCCGSPGGYLYRFVAATGKVHWSQPFYAQHAYQWAPLVADGAVFFHPESGLTALDVASGGPRFTTPATGGGETTPLMVKDEIYVVTGGRISAVTPATGNVSWWLEPERHSTFGPELPISDGEQIYISEGSRVLAYRPHHDELVWSTEPMDYTYAAPLAAAHGNVYAYLLGALVALDARTGRAAWTFDGDGRLSNTPVAAGRWVYVASDAKVFAVDSTTHQKVWEAAPGGALSIADGHLYVAQSDGKLAAYDFTR